MNYAIEADGLVKTFGSEVRALNGVSLRVKQGTVLGLLGPNGAGKTTTVRVLTTTLVPDSGRATVNGFDVVKQALRGVAEVQHHGARFARALGLQKQRKAPFIVQDAAIVGAGGRPLALHARNLGRAVENIRGAVHENADREPIDGGNLNGRCAHGLHAHEGGGGA